MIGSHVGGLSMKHLTGGILLLLLTWSAAWSDNKPQAQPPTPKEQYDALMKEYQQAQQELFNGVTSLGEARKRRRAGSPQLGKALDKLVEWADQYPKDPAALDALLLVVTGEGVGNDKAARRKALELLV